jgi:transposase-like protein
MAGTASDERVSGPNTDKFKAAPRRRYPFTEKLAIVRECESCGASVAEVARRHNLNANMLHNWRKLVRNSLAGRQQALAGPEPTFVPVIIDDNPANESPVPHHTAPILKAAADVKRPESQSVKTREVCARADGPTAKCSGEIAIDLPNGVCMRFDSAVDEGALRRVLAVLMVQG